MRELESSLQQFGEFLLKAGLVREKVAPYFVRWVRRFCDDLERSGRCEDWQVRQAEQALRLYFVNFLNRQEWHRPPARPWWTSTGAPAPWRHCSTCEPA
jgi:hypothetical protein